LDYLCRGQGYKNFRVDIYEKTPQALNEESFLGVRRTITTTWLNKGETIDFTPQMATGTDQGLEEPPFEDKTAFDMLIPGSEAGFVNNQYLGLKFVAN
jgi:hypothetical protein